MALFEDKPGLPTYPRRKPTPKPRPPVVPAGPKLPPRETTYPVAGEPEFPKKPAKTSRKGGDPGGPGPADWRYRFYMAHGRWPNDKDYQDYKWSLDFQRLYGRPPSEEDWRAHALAQGGEGGGGGSEQPETVGQIISRLLFPEQFQLHPYMRDFGRYVEELLTQNPEFAIAPPELTEEGKLAPPPEEAEPLEEFESVETYAAAWNEFLRSLAQLSLEQQQYYQGLRYSPETGWYRSGAVPLLPHPEYV